MTRIALHPRTNKKVSIQEWELKYKEEKGCPKCLICDYDLYVRASSSPGVSTHFVHKQGSNCSSIGDNRKRYDTLFPREKDYVNAKKLKKTLLSNMELVFQKCKSIFGKGFRRKDFRNVIHKASERDIWLYKGLTMEYLPYVLLVNYGIFQKNEYREKVYFVFDAKLSRYEDLWIRPKEIKKKVWRVYPDDKDIEEVKIEFDTSTLAPDWFMLYAIGSQYKEEEFLNW